MHAEHMIDPRDLPPVMLGPGSCCEIDEHLARVRCSCGNPKPTDAIEGAIRAEAVVREFARLSMKSNIDLDAWIQHKTPTMPEPESEVEAWRAYTDALIEGRRLDAAFGLSNRAAKDFMAANLPALRAALGGAA